MGPKGACNVQEEHGQVLNEAGTANAQTRNREHLDDRRENTEGIYASTPGLKRTASSCWRNKRVSIRQACRSSAAGTRDHHGLSHWQCCEEIAVGVHHEEREATPKDDAEGRSRQLVGTALKLCRSRPDEYTPRTLWKTNENTTQ